MKIRLGFVSNSSSSSFICDCCKQEVSGWDITQKECENGHVFCEDCFRQYDVETDDEDDESDYLKTCPICSLEVYDESEMCSYLFTKFGIHREDVFKEIKAKNKRRKKIHDFEYIQIVCEKNSVKVDDILVEIKERFITWEAFDDFLAKG